MIICKNCKAENEMDAERCGHCGKDLLPGKSTIAKIGGALLCLAIAGLCFYIGHTQPWTSTGSNGSGVLVQFWYILGAIYIPAAFWLAFSKGDKSRQYAKRAKKYLQSDPRQALYDLTQAIKQIRGMNNPDYWAKRVAVFDKIEPNDEEKITEINFLIKTLNEAPKRGFAQLSNQTRMLIARKVVTLQQDQVKSLLKQGKNHEAIQSILAMLDFAEVHINDIHSFQMDAIQFGAGVTLHLRGQLKDQIAKIRKTLLEAKLITAHGFCRNCQKETNLDNNMNCVECGKSKLKTITYAVTEGLQ